MLLLITCRLVASVLTRLRHHTASLLTILTADYSLIKPAHLDLALTNGVLTPSVFDYLLRDRFLFKTIFPV